MVRNNEKAVSLKKRRIAYLIFLSALFILFVLAYQKMNPSNAADSIRVTEMKTYSTIRKGTVIWHDAEFTIVYYTVDSNNDSTTTKEIATKNDEGIWTVTISDRFDDWHCDPDIFSGVGAEYGFTDDSTFNKTHNFIKFVDKNDDPIKTVISSTKYYIEAGDVEAMAPAAADVPDIVEPEGTYTFNGAWSPSPFAEIRNPNGPYGGTTYTYTAQYDVTKNKYTITFTDEEGNYLLDDAGNEFQPAKYDYGTKASDIKTPATPTKASDSYYDYTFSGWDKEIADVTEDSTYVAQFTATARKYKIIYNLDGGTNSDSNPSEYTYGVGVESFADASKDGYTFDGWYSDAGFTTKVSGVSADSINDITLYAKFTEVATEAPTEENTEAPKVEPPTETPTSKVNTPVNTKSPKTGDNVPIMIIVAIMLVSLAGIVIIMIRKAKTKEEE